MFNPNRVNIWPILCSFTCGGGVGCTGSCMQVRCEGLYCEAIGKDFDGVEFNGPTQNIQNTSITGTTDLV